MTRLKKRSLTRLIAVQIYYQYDFYKEQKEIKEIKDAVINNYLLDENENLSSYQEKIDSNFLENLTSQFSNIHQFDEEIEELMENNNKLDVLDNVELQIFRLSAFELKYIKNISAKIIIDEYVDIYASFFDEKKINFANAIIDKLARKNRKEDFENV
jgi:N utilization substance protein B